MSTEMILLIIFSYLLCGFLTIFIYIIRESIKSEIKFLDLSYNDVFDPLDVPPIIAILIFGPISLFVSIMIVIVDSFDTLTSISIEKLGSIKFRDLLRLKK